MDELEQDAIRLESMIPRMNRILFRHGTNDPLSHLSVAQLRMVRLLSGQPRIAAELSAELGMTPSAVSQVTHRLERMGLVVRRPDLQDGRIKRLGLSPTGQSLLQERQALRVQRARTALQGLPESHRRGLIASMEELLSAFGSTMASEADPFLPVADVDPTLPPITPFVPTASPTGS